MSPVLRRFEIVHTVELPHPTELLVKPLVALVLFFLFLFTGCTIQYPLESMARLAGMAAIATAFVAGLVGFFREITASRQVEHEQRVSRGTVRRLERGQLLAAGGSRRETRYHPGARVS